jgi:GTP-binding protein
MLEEEADKICSDIAEQMGWEEDYYQISAFQKMGVTDICQDVMNFLESLPPEEISDSEDEEQAFQWDTAKPRFQQQEYEDDLDDEDDDEDDDHPNVIYTNE